MAQFTYGTFFKILHEHIKPKMATLELDKILLFSAQIDPNLPEGERINKRAKCDLDKTDAAKYRSGKRPILKYITDRFLDKSDIDNVKGIFEVDILPQIQQSDRDSLVSKLCKLIEKDMTLSHETKDAFLKCAKESDITEFLAKACAYVICRKIESNPEQGIKIPEKNRFFCGREEILAQIKTNYKKEIHSQCLYGLGGIGKTQIAIEYAHVNVASYDTICWLDAENRLSLEKSVSKFISTQNILPQDGSSNSQREAFLQFLSQKSKWLVIFDNAEYGTDDEYNVLITYYPTGKIKGHILFTTRCTASFEDAFQVEVPLFSKMEASSFLQNQSRKDDQELAEKLAERLGFLPLALEYAAAYIRETPGVGYEEYISKLDKYSVKVLDRKVGHLAYAHTVREAFHVTLDKLLEDSKTNPIAKSIEQFLNVCAFLSPDDIEIELFSNHGNSLPEPIRQVLLNGLDRDELVRQLVRYSLFRPRSTGLSIHRLLQEVIFDEMQESDREMWLGLARHIFDDFLNYLRKISVAEANQVAKYATLHALNILQHYAILCRDGSKLITKETILEIEREYLIWSVYRIESNYGGAKEPLNSLYQVLKRSHNDIVIFGCALEFYDTVLCHDNIYQATALFNLALTHVALGDIDNARTQFKRAVRIALSVLSGQLPTWNPQYYEETLAFAVDIFHYPKLSNNLLECNDLLSTCFIGLGKAFQAAFKYRPVSIPLFNLNELHSGPSASIHENILAGFQSLAPKLSRYSKRAFVLRLPSLEANSIYRAEFGGESINYIGYCYLFFFPENDSLPVSSESYITAFDVILDNKHGRGNTHGIAEPWNTLAFPIEINTAETVLDYLLKIKIGRKNREAKCSLYEMIIWLAYSLGDVETFFKYYLKRKNLL